MAEQKIKIIYEDRWLLIVEKPAGVVTTRETDIKNKNIYLEDWIGQNYPNNLFRKGIVHRLDKDTSGLVVVAKDESTLVAMKSIFKRREVTKKYLALAGGDLPSDGSMNVPIKRSIYSFGKFKVDPEGKSAVTEFKVLKKLTINGKKYSLVLVNLKTGRTHQIRVHFNYLGWPLAGDKLYGGQTIEGLDRQFLHSTYLSFTHPKLKKMMEFNLELPADLQKIVDKYE